MKIATILNMPAKRKAPTAEDTPFKRHTRSKGQVDLDVANLLNPNSVSNVTPRRRAPIHNPTHPSSQPLLKRPKTKADKASGQSQALETTDSESDDELILSPSSHQALSTPIPHRGNKSDGHFSSETGISASHDSVDNARDVRGKKESPPRTRLNKNCVPKISTRLKSSSSGTPLQSSRVLREDLEENSSNPPSLSQPSHNVKTVPTQIRSYRDSIPQTRISKHLSPNLATDLTQKYVPQHSHQCLNAQKRAMLQALQVFNSSDLSTDGSDNTNDVASQQLIDLLNGSIIRDEGNSCLILGPRGSGKTQILEKCLSNLPTKPVIIRLSGWVQTNDRLAMREIGIQLNQQTGQKFFLNSGDAIPESEDSAEDNPFLDSGTINGPPSGFALPPVSHLPALISIIPTLPRSTIIILDAFDLFALHPRQSLLYCLLDTAQSCRAELGHKGLAVIGLTSRVDTIQLLEKRVKSRFSGRTLRTAPPANLNDWLGLTRAVMKVRCSLDDVNEEWTDFWTNNVEEFLTDGAVTQMLSEVFSVTKDTRMLSRVLTSLIIRLAPSSPLPNSRQLSFAVVSQCQRVHFAFLSDLSYSCMCLLVACIHTETAGHLLFTFEMLYDIFNEQVRASTAAPVQINGGTIGMMRCSREVLMSAFEDLLSMKIFVYASTLSHGVTKGFIKYRCVMDREQVKKAIEKNGHVSLRKWLNKAQ